MYTEEYNNSGDLYKAKTFRTIQLLNVFMSPDMLIHSYK
jgi:hypothetical protein